MSSGARQVDATVETMPSVLWDAVAIPDGHDAVDELGIDGRVLEFVEDQYRQCKPLPDGVGHGSAAEGRPS